MQENHEQLSGNIMGHIITIITISIWSTTFISTKVLLRSFSPIEILVTRFIIGLAVLTILRRPHPGRWIKNFSLIHEIKYLGAGLAGVTVYYLFENIGLTYTQAANISVIISMAPLFTAILSFFAFGDRSVLNKNFLLGFTAAIVGVFMISFGGRAVEISPLGDFLGIAAAVAWAVYSVIIRKIQEKDKDAVSVTRHVFTYGVVFMIPPALIMGFGPDTAALIQPVNVMNILFLGLCASAMCFVTWNYAVKKIGVVTASVYIYFTPVITMTASYFILDESINGIMLLGTLLTIFGLVLSDRRG